MSKQYSKDMDNADIQQPLQGAMKNNSIIKREINSSTEEATSWKLNLYE